MHYRTSESTGSHRVSCPCLASNSREAAPHAGALHLHRGETFCCVKEVNFMLALKKSYHSPSGKQASEICYVKTCRKDEEWNKNFYLRMRKIRGCHILLLGFFYQIPFVCNTEGKFIDSVKHWAQMHTSVCALCHRSVMIQRRIDKSQPCLLVL